MQLLRIVGKCDDHEHIPAGLFAIQKLWVGFSMIFDVLLVFVTLVNIFTRTPSGIWGLTIDALIGVVIFLEIHFFIKALYGLLAMKMSCMRPLALYWVFTIALMGLIALVSISVWLVGSKELEANFAASLTHLVCMFADRKSRCDNVITASNFAVYSCGLCLSVSTIKFLQLSLLNALRRQLFEEAQKVKRQPDTPKEKGKSDSESDDEDRIFGHRPGKPAIKDNSIC